MGTYSWYGPDHPHTAAADLIESESRALLDGYEAALRTAGSVLVRDPTALAQCMEHATCILADVVSSLRRGKVVFDASSIGLAHDIGLTRATQQVQIGESLSAAISLFEVLFSAIGELLVDTEEGDSAIPLVARALHRSLAERVRIASLSYNSYLLNRVHEALLEERRRIARELHDRVGAGISAANRNLELYEMFETTEPARARARMATAQEALRETMYEVRELTTDLRQHVPHGGLEKALLSYLDSAVDSKQVTAAVVVNGDERWAAYDIRSELFLIIREALRNALAHGNPGRVAARVDITPDEVRAVVEDDGCGFDVDDVEPGGAGIDSMRERAGLLSGYATVTSWPGRGTRVEVLIPSRKDGADGRP